MRPEPDRELPGLGPGADPELPGLSPAQALWVRRRYREKAAAIAREDPYRLDREVPGVGFKTADGLACRLGLPADSPQRVRAGILHCLRERADDGDVCLPFHRLVREAQALLEVDRRLVASTIERMGSEGELAIERPPAGLEQDSSVYLPELHAAEEGVAEGLAGLAQGKGLMDPADVEAGIAGCTAALAVTLAPGQVEAIRAALCRKLTVITGGPGTGKTTVLRALLELCDGAGLRVLLAAPTGRAARRMADATGREARTIHRMLEYSPGAGFRRDRTNPLECDLVVVDEASMVDVLLMHHLLKALPEAQDGAAAGGRGPALVLVGDADQLPSVGPGQLLRDIIASGIAAVVHLTEAFRQARESDIVAAAHRILQGLLPEEHRSRGHGDFVVIEEADPARASRIIVELVRDRIPRRLSVDPLEGIQVLAPMHKGVAGSTSLNRALQAALNGGGAPLAARGGLLGPASRLFRIGDKVMQRRNNYEKGVFNGDVGRITGLRGDDGAVVVSFDGEEKLYGAEEIAQLSLAYALSVHKAQGSEYPAVVLALLDEHAAMLERTLLYTAVTRARRLVVIVGSRAALRTAVRRADTRARYTGLLQRLTRLLPAGP